MNHIKDERGVTLFEALVAMALLGIVLTGLVPSLMSYAEINTSNEVRTEAIQAAQISMEGLRRLDFDSMPGPSPDSTTGTVLVGERSFDVVTRFCSNTTYCGVGSRHIYLEVSFDGKLVYTTETIFTELR